MKQKISTFFTKYPTLSIAFTCILFISIQALFSFCTKIKCPGYSNPYFDKWFPYQTGQSFYFKNQHGQYDTLHIREVSKTGPYKESGGYGSRQCHSSASILAGRSNLSSASLPVLNVQTNSDIDIEVGVKNMKVWGSRLTDTGIVIHPSYCKSVFLATYVLGSKTYSKVQQLTRDTTSLKGGVYRIWLAQSHGLIGYEEYPSENLYIKQ